MATTRDDIRKWLEEGKAAGATHLIVACDTFSWENYPVFVQPGEDAREKTDEHGKKDMTKIMEVYSLGKDWETQLNEHRAYHFD